MSDDTCTATKNDGEPCEYTAKYDDGKCGIHTDESESGGPGRPFTLSEDDHDAILQAAREGKSESGCARAAGVDWHQLDNYLDATPEFRRSFAQARAQGESVLLQGGLRDPDVDSSMAKFLLASSFDYVKAEKREVTGEGGGAVEVVINESVVED